MCVCAGCEEWGEGWEKEQGRKKAVKSGAHMHYADAPDICISTKCTCPTLNKSSAIRYLECGDAFELCIIYVKPSQLML